MVHRTGHPAFEAGAARNGSSAAFTIVVVFGQSKGRPSSWALKRHLSFRGMVDGEVQRLLPAISGR